MTPQLELITEYDAFFPGTIAASRVIWDVGEENPPPIGIEARLVWSTSGKGDEDRHVIKNIRWEPNKAQGERQVNFQLPWGPYSFSGKLISLIWTIEVIMFPSKVSVRKEIIVAHNAEEVLLTPVQPTGLNTFAQ